MAIVVDFKGNEFRDSASLRQFYHADMLLHSTLLIFSLNELGGCVHCSCVLHE